MICNPPQRNASLRENKRRVKDTGKAANPLLLKVQSSSLLNCGAEIQNSRRRRRCSSYLLPVGATGPASRGSEPVWASERSRLYCRKHPRITDVALNDGGVGEPQLKHRCVLRTTSDVHAAFGVAAAGLEGQAVARDPAANGEEGQQACGKPQLLTPLRRQLVEGDLLK